MAGELRASPAQCGDSPALAHQVDSGMLRQVNRQTVQESGPSGPEMPTAAVEDVNLLSSVI